VDRGTLTAPERPNHVLGVDFKEWFPTGDGRRCDPLTVTDPHSRFILNKMKGPSLYNGSLGGWQIPKPSVVEKPWPQA
jgi:hypothetical protein